MAGPQPSSRIDRLLRLTRAEGATALTAGVGYPNPNRCHFLSKDIWHTCEPEMVDSEDWIDRTIGVG